MSVNEYLTRINRIREIDTEVQKLTDEVIENFTPNLERQIRALEEERLELIPRNADESNLMDSIAISFNL